MSNSPQKTNPNSGDKSFEALAKLMPTLSKGRSDGVAIAAITGIIIAFMTTIIVGGVVLTVSPKPSPLGQPAQLEQPAKSVKASP